MRGGCTQILQFHRIRNQVGPTGGEDLVPASPGRDSQNSMGDIDIRDSNENEGTHDHQGALCEGQELIDRGVRAGECQQRLDVTEEVVDGVGPTEGQAGHNDGVGEEWRWDTPARTLSPSWKQQPGVHGGGNVVGGRWPRSGPRPWQPGGSCQWSQRPQRNTSGPDTGRRGIPFSESACSLIFVARTTVIKQMSTRDKLEEEAWRCGGGNSSGWLP